MVTIETYFESLAILRVESLVSDFHLDVTSDVKRNKPVVAVEVVVNGTELYYMGIFTRYSSIAVMRVQKTKV